MIITTSKTYIRHKFVATLILYSSFETKLSIWSFDTRILSFLLPVTNFGCILKDLAQWLSEKHILNLLTNANVLRNIRNYDILFIYVAVQLMS